jgi:hypothetical protein
MVSVRLEIIAYFSRAQGRCSRRHDETIPAAEKPVTERRRLAARDHRLDHVKGRFGETVRD